MISAHRCVTHPSNFIVFRFVIYGAPYILAFCFAHSSLILYQLIARTLFRAHMNIVTGPLINYPNMACSTDGCTTLFTKSGLPCTFHIFRLNCDDIRKTYHWWLNFLRNVCAFCSSRGFSVPKSLRLSIGAKMLTSRVFVAPFRFSIHHFHFLCIAYFLLIRF